MSRASRLVPRFRAGVPSCGGPARLDPDGAGWSRARTRLDLASRGSSAARTASASASCRRTRPRSKRGATMSKADTNWLELDASISTEPTTWPASYEVTRQHVEGAIEGLDRYARRLGQLTFGQ